jgi:hypothetical protein
MATSSFAQLSSPGVQDDDAFWTEYLNLASSTDARLVQDWTKVIDVLLVFVRCYLPLCFTVSLSQYFFV